jgi:serine protease Do
MCVFSRRSGSTGGPLFDAEGNVVGLLSFRKRGANPKFYAVPVEWAVDAVKRNADQVQDATRFSSLPFWDGQGDELPFFMQASSLETEQCREELRLLCEVRQVELPTSGEPAFIESRIDEHFGRFEAAHDQLLEAVDRDAQHVLAWASLVRVRLYLEGISDAHSAYSQLQNQNMHLANQLIENGLIAGY